MPRSLIVLVLFALMTQLQGCKGNRHPAPATASSVPIPGTDDTAKAHPVTAQTSPPVVDATRRYSELAFFNSLSGSLEIELSEPAKPVSDKVANLAAPPGAKVKSLRLVLGVLEGEVVRKLTDSELDTVALRQAQVTLHAESGEAVQHDAPNGEYFTVRDLIQAVEKTESTLRGKTEWLGGIDVHHIYFEGLEATKPGHFEILWGS